MPADTESAGEWVSLTDLAGRLGVTRPAVRLRVDRFERAGLLKTRSQGRERLVNVAEFEAAAEVSTDAVRQANGRQHTAKGAEDGAAPILQKEQARKVKFQADMAEMNYLEARKRLLPVEAVADAMAKAAGEMVRVLEAVPGRAAEFASAVAQDGEMGARRVLKEMVRTVRERLASSMTILASAEEPEGEMIRYEKAEAAGTDNSRLALDPGKRETTIPVSDVPRGRGRPKSTGVKPWEAAGKSRAAWYREQAKAASAGAR